MKNVISILTLILLTTLWLNAQSKYEVGMQKAMDLLEEDKHLEAVALFERIGQAEKEKWVPLYHAANVLINQSFSIEKKKDRTAQLERAKELLDEAQQRSEDNSELVTLQGMYYLSYLDMSPMVYGMTYPAKIQKLHEKAIELDPDNPRAYLNKIQFEMGSARFFGKDMAPYCKQMQEIIPKFENQTVDVPFAPSYGLEAAQSIANSCQ